MASFDPALLEQHAIAQLARALNTRQLIAVVGSGVSAGYGQPNWRELLRDTAEMVREKLLELPEFPRGASQDDIVKEAKARTPELASLVQTFQEAIFDQEDMPADQIPIAFEICENLFAGIRIRKLDGLGKSISHRRETREAHRLLRERLKWQLKDDRGRAELLMNKLRARLSAGSANLVATRIKNRLTFEAPPGFDSRENRDEFAAAFGHLLYCPRNVPGAVSASQILYSLHRGGRTATNRLIAQWLEADQRSKGPDIHHLIDAGLLLLSDAQVEQALNQLEAAATKLIDKALNEAMRTSRAFLPRYRDPLAVLVDELKVKRILTTNYDGEIDRLLEGRGFVEVARHSYAAEKGGVREPGPAPSSRALLVDGSLKRAEILAYEAGASAFLYDYGADTREHRIQVLHFHGRARSAPSWLVLSEKDYRERYARDDEPQTRADDAMRLVFTANPLLFLGLGMQEPDILRPLRTYSEDISRLCDRPAVALMPRLNKDLWQRASRTEGLSRYGVYKLYYGEAKIRLNGEVHTDPAFMGRLVTWHTNVRSLIRAKIAAHDPDLDPKEAQDAVEAALANLKASLLALRPRLIEVEGDLTAALEVRQLVFGVRAMSHALRHQTLRPYELEAFKNACGGFLSAIFTTFMTAWLRHMITRWSDWRDQWSAPPYLREPGGAKVRKSLDHWETTRHRTVLRNLDLEDADSIETAPVQAKAPSTDRFFAGGPSPAFQVLRAALHNNIAPPSQGRRIFYLLGDRGAGMGDVFSVMRSPRRFAFLCHWLLLASPLQVGSDTKREERDQRASEHTRNIHRAFFNLGMSHEVVSTFDSLNRFLENFANEADGRGAQPQDEAYLTDRLGRTEAVLRRLVACATTEGPDQEGGVRRAVVVFNHFGVLFDEAGQPKNAQVRRLFELLTSDRYSQAPLDFIFMMSEQRLPENVRATYEATPFSPVKLLRMAGGDPTTEGRLLERFRTTFGPSHLALPSLGDGAKAQTYVYFLQPVRPVAFAIRFFPRAASAVAHLSACSHQSDVVVRFMPATPGGATSTLPVTPLYFGDEAEVRRFQIAMRDAFEDSLRSGDDGLDESQRLQRIAECFAGEEIDSILLEALTKADAAVGDPQFESKPLLPIQQTKAVVSRRLRQVQQATSHLSDRREKDLFRELLSIAGHNRYALTLLFAAIDDMIARRMAQSPQNVVNLTAVRRFIRQLRLATAGKNPTVREDIVITQVLQLYQTDTLSSLGDPLPAWPAGLSHQTGADGGTPQHMLFELQERILVALAIIGQPVEPAVLTGVQSVAAALEELATAMKLTGHKARISLLGRVLDLLVSRCLLFRIAPKGSEVSQAGAEAYRFATHKSLRRHLYRHFNAPFIDYSDVDQLTVSLYATQPSDLPRPTAEGHRRVRQLIEQLSRFERLEHQPSHLSRDPFLEEAKGTAERRRIDRSRLRAAYGALRSIYSIGVVSRFSAYEDEGIETPDNGYFESHRLRVRWMLRMANHLDGAQDRDENTGEPLKTFHAEEIVWLFNECGVLSLAQGRISDAATLLSQAQKFARDFIEPREWGPLHARIGVNRAIADIERGRLREAKVLLERVRAEGEQEHPALVLVAKGYLALIQDLMGDAPSAAAVYEEIVPALAKMGRLRSAAIFSIQHSDCLRGYGTAFFERAMELSEQACAYATEGGHEDVRQIGQLSSTWIEIARFGSSIDTARRSRLEATLNDISSYATMMGMPRLICRTALARGSFHLAHGDFRAAASYAQDALRTATRHDIELRKISAMRLLGSALLRLKAPEARGLLVRARELAYHIDFNAEIGRIEEALVEADRL